MRFDELPIYEAIYHVRREISNPGSDDWLLSRREELCRMIQQHLPIGAPFVADQMIDAWVRSRKSPQSKIDLTVQVAMTHGRKCFMSGRGRGDCSDVIDLDRILPGSRGGEYSLENCVIMCSYHNRQRNDRSLEDYIAAPSSE